MTRQVVITGKASQANDVRAAVGSRYGAILAAEDHLPDLCEPEDVNPAWERWTTALLRPYGLYGAKPATGGRKAAKLRAIRVALKTPTPAIACRRELDIREFVGPLGVRVEDKRPLQLASLEDAGCDPGTL